MDQAKELLIPSEHTLKVAELIDASRIEGHVIAGRYRLWNFLEEILPEMGNGNDWNLDSSNATKLKIVQSANDK